MDAANGQIRITGFIWRCGGGSAILIARWDRSRCGRRTRILVVAFNGEIYNHVELRRELEAAGASFRTDHSDTEVLLNASPGGGSELTNHLNGMWAFAE